MYVIELYFPNEEKPFGVVGINDDGTPYMEGVEEDMFEDILEGPIDDPEGEIIESSNSEEYMEAVKFKLLKTAYDNELVIKGPFKR